MSPLAAAIRLVLVASLWALVGESGHADELADCQQLFLSGKYAECITAAAPHAAASADKFEKFAELKGRSEAALGKYAEAVQTLQAATTANPLSLPNQFLLIELLPFTGQIERVPVQKREFELAVSSGAGRFTQDSSNLITLAQFALNQGADPKQVQEVMLQRGKRFDPTNILPHLASGQLALDKRDFQFAAESFRAARKLDPNHPEAIFGLAQALRDSNSQDAAALFEQTLTINPHHAGALMIQVEGLVNQEQYEGAIELLDRLNKTNPHHPDALAMKAAIHFILNQDEEADQFRAAALSTWSSNPRVDYLIGKTLSQKYRFEAGSQAQQRALAFDHNYLPAQKQLALDLLRLGNEQDGWRIADLVYTRDRYDIASYNLVTLRDEIEKFTTLEQSGFTVRMEKREAEIYGERVLALLSEAKSTLCEKYDVELPKTVLVEIFPKPADFAVRTFGMPGADAYLGVCFGNVITAKSPASQTTQPVNWESTLWHEFAHVVTLNKTHNRMPRWLSEGISVYEERQRNPLWGEKMTPAYRNMILEGELTPISELSGAFLAPKSSLHIMFAYYESSLVVEYLIENFGHSTLLEILDDLAVGMNINETIERRTVPMKQLEEEFQKWVENQARLFGWYVDWSPADFSKLKQSDDVAASLIQWSKSHPRNYTGLKTCAELLKKLGRFEDAALVFEKASMVFQLETGPQSAAAQLALLQNQLGNTAAEREALEMWTAHDDDAAAGLLRLLELTTAEENWEQTQTYAQRLLAIKPLIPQPHASAALAAERLNQPAEAAIALKTLLTMSPATLADLHYRLAVQLRAIGNDTDARRHTLHSLEEAPRYRAALNLLLELQEQK